MCLELLARFIRCLSRIVVAWWPWLAVDVAFARLLVSLVLADMKN